MANRWYPKGLEHFAKGDVAFLSDTIKIYLIAAGYVANFTTDEFVSHLSAIVATSAALASKTCTSGILNAASPTLTAVSGSVVTQVVMAKDTGSGATSPLLVYWDTGTGIPLTPNGGDISVNFDTGANKIAVLFEALGDRVRRLLNHVRGWMPGPAQWPALPVSIRLSLPDGRRLLLEVR